MVEFLASRSRVQNLQRCPRAGYWLDEARGTGFSPARVATPLATGGAVHTGLEHLMNVCRGIDPVKDGGTWNIEDAVSAAVSAFNAECAGRALDIEALESQSYVYAEQLALTEALVRLAGMRIVPKILEQYEVLEVERMDISTLTSGEDWSVVWRSIPDALLRSRADGDLYLLSWKTTSEYSAQRDQDARTDTQGLSEAWAVEERLQMWREKWVRQTAGKFTLERAAYPTGNTDLPVWFWEHMQNGGPIEIRGVQMVYLVKGQRRRQELADGTTRYRTGSGLLHGYRKDPAAGLATTEYATELYYVCPAPHSFRYAKGGVCPGGKTHKRGDEWTAFDVWDTQGGVKAWMELLGKRGTADPEDTLDKYWAMPVPHYRTRAAAESWLRQTRAIQARNARNLLQVQEYERALAAGEDIGDTLACALDEFFPQTTERCVDWFHRRCPCWELCHGPAHVADDPVGSGLYSVKTQYTQSVEEVDG